MNLENKILIAQILAPFGIKGWLKIKSFADPHENISTYKNFEILIDDCLEKIDIENITFEKDIKIKIKGIDDRTTAEQYLKKEIYIDRNELPSLGENEYYWQDLIGLQVFSEDKKNVGKVSNLIRTGANDVIVITDKEEKEHLVPFIQGSAIIEINLLENSLLVSKDYLE